MPTLTPEDKLRKKVILALSKDPTLTVFDNDGPNENGIDIIVIKQDIFGDVKRYGIQAKVGDIYTQRRGRNSGINEIIGQLATAFGHPFPPDSQYLDAVYLLTDGEIKPNAREYVVSARLGFRTIYFVDKHLLDPFFKERLKENEA